MRRLKERLIDLCVNQPLIVSAAVANLIVWLGLWGVHLEPNVETGIKVGVNGVVYVVTWLMVTPNYETKRGANGHTRIRTRRH